MKYYAYEDCNDFLKANFDRITPTDHFYMFDVSDYTRITGREVTDLDTSKLPFFTVSIDHINGDDELPAYRVDFAFIDHAGTFKEASVFSYGFNFESAPKMIITDNDIWNFINSEFNRIFSGFRYGEEESPKNLYGRALYKFHKNMHYMFAVPNKGYWMSQDTVDLFDKFDIRLNPRPTVVGNVPTAHFHWIGHQWRNFSNVKQDFRYKKTLMDFQTYYAGEFDRMMRDFQVEESYENPEFDNPYGFEQPPLPTP